MIARLRRHEALGLPDEPRAAPFPVQRRRGRTFTVLAALAWSTAGVLQRGLSVSTADQLAGRALFAVLGLLLYVAVSERRRLVRAFRSIGGGGLAVAALMAASSTGFIVALNHTTVANVLFMQALAPIIAAVLGMAVLGEHVTGRTWLALLVAVVGVGLMVGGPGRPGALGGSMSFLMALSFAAMLVVTRHRSDVSMAPATCLSQALVFVAAAPFAHARAVGGRDLLLLVLLGVGQIGLGLVFLTIGARLIPVAEVALITLLEVVLAPLWVWIAVAEQPGPWTLVGGAIVIGAVLIQIRADSPRVTGTP
jgi:drug/metabolite transporter (DMT)-like permease